MVGIVAAGRCPTIRIPDVNQEYFMAFIYALISGFPLLVFLIAVIAAGLRIVQQYERGVVFRLGRIAGTKGPGLCFIIPVLDRLQKLDLRTVALDVPTQEGITKDNVTLKVNAVVYYRVADPTKAIVEVEDYRRATWQIAQTSLRNVIGQSELDEILADRDQINAKLREIIDESTEPWGINVLLVEIKDVELPENMKRAMAKQAEAERERRAKVINAEGEFQASQQLANAAEVLATHPSAMQLRYLQTLTEIAEEQNTVVLFPVPIDILSMFIPGLKHELPQNNDNPNPDKGALPG